MKEIPLGGKYGHLSAIVDDEDFDHLIQYNWLYFKNGGGIYARRTFAAEDGRRGNQMMHNYLTGWPLVDHVNHNGLDNRRSNLRAATQKENLRNKQKFEMKNCKSLQSRYKGVCKKRNAWRATISVDKKQVNLGTHATEEEAARAYDRAALKHYGEFAHINFPEEK